MNDNPYASTGPDENAPKPRRSFSRWVEWGIALGIIFVVVLVLLPVPHRGREPARRSQCKNNLKQIALALHNYHERYGGLPPAYTVDENGKPLHSWRALILPFIGQDVLYRKIDFSKPWDDPANAEVFQTAVHEYRCPSDPSESKNTSYFALVGEDFVFHPTQSRKFEEIKDGLKNTLMIVESDLSYPVHWMAPEDPGAEIFLQLNKDTKTIHVGVTQTVFADGIARAILLNVPSDTRSALLTIDGQETLGEF